MIKLDSPLSLESKSSCPTSYVGRISVSVSDDASAVRRMGQVVIDSFPKSVRTFPYNHRDRDSVPFSFLYTVSKGTTLPVVV